MLLHNTGLRTMPLRRQEALRVSNAKTKREAVEMGLRALIRLKKQEDIKALRGTLTWDGDLDAMRTDG